MGGGGLRVVRSRLLLEDPDALPVRGECVGVSTGLGRSRSRSRLIRSRSRVDVRRVALRPSEPDVIPAEGELFRWSVL